jgi:indolepyruvate ferredoxin oxidoreductase
MAPPLLARAKNGGPPRKLRLGAWMWPVLHALAKARRLRGGRFDPFGRAEERRMERALIDRFEARVDALLTLLAAGTLKTATEIAALPLAMRGFGHVKIGNVALARAREAELLHRIDPARWPRPPGGATAGQIRGIAVVAG